MAGSAKSKKPIRRKSPSRSRLPPVVPFAIAAALVIGGLFAWWVLTQESSVPEAKSVCTLIIDRTGSSDTPAVRDNYANAVEATVKGCRDKAAVLSIYSVDGTSGRSEIIGNPYEFFDPDQAKDPLLEAQLDSLAEKATTTAIDAINAPAGSGGGSEILSAMEQAAKASVAAYGQLGVPQFLVVLTDGLQNSPDAGVNIGEVINGQLSPDDLVAEVDRVGLTPTSLNGFLVSMVGVLAGEGAGGKPLTPESEKLIQQFWTTTIDGVGGNLCYYGKQVSVLPVAC